MAPLLFRALPEQIRRGDLMEWEADVYGQQCRNEVCVLSLLFHTLCIGAWFNTTKHMAKDIKHLAADAEC